MHRRHNERSPFDPLSHLVSMRKTSRRLGGTALSNADDQRRESIRTYDNRGIPLPGLRSARQRLSLTQRELATRAGMGQGTICKLETLQRGAYPQTLQKLAVALGVSPADLVDDRVDQ
jgi:DNA-binding XRE family transcriptional regulator